MNQDAIERAHKAHWCDQFAQLFARRQACSEELSRAVAELLHPSLGRMPPKYALTTIDPDLVAALQDRCRDAL